MSLYIQLLVDIWVIFQFGLLLVGRSWLEDAAGMTLMRTDPALELSQGEGKPEVRDRDLSGSGSGGWNRPGEPPGIFAAAYVSFACILDGCSG